MTTSTKTHKYEEAVNIERSFIKTGEKSFFFGLFKAPAGFVEEHLIHTGRCKRCAGSEFTQEHGYSKPEVPFSERLLGRPLEKAFPPAQRSSVHRGQVDLGKQIDELAQFLMNEYPREITDGGAVDVAIKILKKQKTPRLSSGLVVYNGDHKKIGELKMELKFVPLEEK